MLRVLGFFSGVLLCSVVVGQELPLVSGVEAQPLKAQAQRVAQALEYLGEPLTPAQRAALDKAVAIINEDAAVEAIQKVLDTRCLVGVNINPKAA